MRRSEAVRDMEGNLISGSLRGEPQALPRIPFLPYRSLIPTPLGHLISIICHISLQVH
jgi:hypothetical protein